MTPGTRFLIAVAMADSVERTVQLPRLRQEQQRYTDELQVTNYWPGTDPAYNVSQGELRQLSSALGASMLP